MNILNLIKIVIFSVLIFGCQPSQSNDLIHGDNINQDIDLSRNYRKNKWRWNRLSDVTSHCSIYDSSDNDPFYCLAQACDEAGGEYNEQTHKCDCSEVSNAFLVFTSQFGGACLPPRVEEFDEKSNFLYIENRAEDIYENSETIFGYYETLEESPYQLSPLFNFTYNLLTVDSTVDDKEWLINLERDTRHQSVLGSSLVAQQHLFLSENEEEAKHPLAIEVNQWLKAGYKYNNFKIIGDEGCLSLCYAEAWRNYYGGYAVIRDLFLEGQKVSTKVYFTESRDLSSYYAMVTVGLTGQSNLVYERKSELQSAAIFKHSVDVYSAHQELIADNVSMSPEMDYSQEIKDEVGYPSEAQADSSMVTICVWGVNPFSLKDYWDRVVFGPYANESQDFQGSLWGWHKNREANPLTYSQGAYAHYEWGYSPKRSAWEASKHHRSVMESVLVWSETSTVTAMHYLSCLDSDEDMNPLLEANYPGRVINVSAFQEISGRSCQKAIEAVKKTESRLLWVLAAGNDGRSTCEQEMMGLPNVISVTSIDPSQPRRIEMGVQKGRGRIDTASFRAVDHGPGTSFAAPVVAGLASEIFQNHPGLKPSDVKKALTLGVEFSQMSVTSGGRTTRDRSMAVAKIISSNPSLNNRLVLAQLYNKDPNISSADLNREKRKVERRVNAKNKELKELEEKLKQLKECQENDDEDSEDGLWSWFSDDNCDDYEDDLEIEIEVIKRERDQVSSALRPLEQELRRIKQTIHERKNFENHWKWLR
ncbi:MAG: S8/S53 family peptidase [Bdellovibrionales bacterium]|nr:S8/S53 family peptidase [Bdellovibrionales bacterium]NQZ18114.1 S8/S53 family peptidase [Bdellovibrionales bacterium]